ncbi:MAG: hypothetical protein NTY19_24350 [Planctomycetota bacterium]|nr:hypothetical protein [Planctomycetota bacterium]
MVTHVIAMGGRPPSVPETVSEAIRQVEEMARRWLMWQGYVEKPKRDQRGKPGKSMLERLPEDMRSQLEALLDGMKTLQETVSTAILHLRPVAPRPTGTGRSKVKPVKDRRGGAG